MQRFFSVPKGYFGKVIPQDREEDNDNRVCFIRQSTYNEIKEIICDSEVTEVKRRISKQRREHTDQFGKIKIQFDELRKENAELKAMVVQVLQLLTPEAKNSLDP